MEKILKKVLHDKNINGIMFVLKEKGGINMKKIISTLILFVMIVALATTLVKAVTASSLVSDLYGLGKKYGATNADKVKAERFVSENPITDAQAQEIYAKAQEAIKVLEEAGATNFKKLNTELNAEQKKKFRAICQEAADIFGVTLTYRNGNVEVYKDGKLIDVYTFTDKLAYTGKNVNLVLVVSSVAVIALAATFVLRKKFANA